MRNVTCICCLEATGSWLLVVALVCTVACQASPEVPPDDQHRLDTVALSVELESLGGIGGMSVDATGNVVMANFNRYVWRISPAGEVDVLADDFAAASGNTISLRYLDPKKKLSPRKANPGTPGTGFGSADKLKWIEKEVKVKPKMKNCTMDGIWDHLYDTVRNRKKFPITLDEALQVMWVVSQVKKGTKFANK